MQSLNQFSCFIIGSGTLPIQCADILLHRGHEIYGIVSSDAALIQWAQGEIYPITRKWMIS